MSETSSSKKVAFLMGAGLSASAELPASVALANRFKARIQTIADGSRAPVLLKNLFYYLEGGIRLQRAKRGLDPSSDVNIEDIAIAARRLHDRETNALAPFISGWHPHLLQMLLQEASLLDQFLDALFDHLEEDLRTPAAEKIAFMDRLADICQDNGGLDVFTLNYDLCIEKALESTHNFQVIDGFDSSGWNPKLFKQDGHSVLRLYKLHGSLNWINSPVMGLVSLAHLDTEAATELFGMRPHLVFGTDVKLSGQQPFFSLAHLFFEALCCVDLLVVVGYGFGDEYVNALIDQSMRSNRRLRLLVVSRTADELAVQHDQLLGSNRRVRLVKAEARPILENHGLKCLIKKTLESAEGDPF